MMQRSVDGQSDPVLVTIPELGSLEGITGTTAWTSQPILQFLNVKYAESPSGDRRFKVRIVNRYLCGIKP